MKFKEMDQESFFNSEEATLINSILINCVGQSGLGAILQSLGYNFDAVERAKNAFKLMYTGF